MDRIEVMWVYICVFEWWSFKLVFFDLNILVFIVIEVIKVMEKCLGVVLLERIIWCVFFIIDGEIFYYRCISIINDVEEVEYGFFIFIF